MHGELPKGERSWRLILSSPILRGRAATTFSLSPNASSPPHAVVGRAALSQYYHDYHGESLLKATLVNSAFFGEGASEEPRVPTLYEDVAEELDNVRQGLFFAASCLQTAVECNCVEDVNLAVAIEVRQGFWKPDFSKDILRNRNFFKGFCKHLSDF